MIPVIGTVMAAMAMIVELKIDGVLTASGSEPSFELDTLTLTEGIHTVMLVARTADGAAAVAWTSITVDNRP